MIGRLRTDRTLRQAQEELRVLAPSFRELFPWKMPEEYGKSVSVVRLQDQIVGDVRPTLLVLLAAIVAVLLIVCMNVANLLLTRGLSRARELAIRAAVGATRGRLVRQLLVESLTVALLAGAAGTIGAFALLRLLLSLLPADVPRVDEIGMDVRVLMFALVISALTGLFFCGLAAIRASSGPSDNSLQHTARPMMPGRAERRLARLLTMAEFALAVVLVVSAALLLKSLWNLMGVHPGFRAEHLVSASVAPMETRYSRPDLRRRFAEDLLVRLNGLPGVRMAAAGSAIPLAGGAFGS